jgi:hypothetical protein
MPPTPSRTRTPTVPAQRDKRPIPHLVAAEAVELVVIDPKYLRTSTNVPAELNHTPVFIGNIRQHGVLEAITARRDAAGNLWTERGYRGAAAAVEACLLQDPVVRRSIRATASRRAVCPSSALGAHYGAGQRSRRAAA